MKTKTLFRWETHAHTAEGSACGRASGAEMALACKASGYDGLFITDHFFCGNCRPDRSLPWEEWVRQFCLGYHLAAAEGRKIGLTVCFGWEYSWDGTDFLTYGLSPDWLAAHPETVSVTPVQYLRLIRDAGGALVQAHPFREAHYIPYFKLLPEYVDAVETYNGGNAPEWNDRALWYAESYGLLQTAGSDAHTAEQFSGGILTAQKITDTAGYAELLRSGGIRGLICGMQDCLFPEDAP